MSVTYTIEYLQYLVNTTYNSGPMHLKTLKFSKGDFFNRILSTAVHVWVLSHKCHISSPTFEKLFLPEAFYNTG